MAALVAPKDVAHLHPMPLVRIPEPFDHDQFVFELKHDGFRALAVIRGHHGELISRRGHVYGFLERRGVDLFRAVCRSDLEGVVILRLRCP
jgi:ATP-dependent DNA ligase